MGFMLLRDAINIWHCSRFYATHKSPVLLFQRLNRCPSAFRLWEQWDVKPSEYDGPSLPRPLFPSPGQPGLRVRQHESTAANSNVRWVQHNDVPIKICTKLSKPLIVLEFWFHCSSTLKCSWISLKCPQVFWFPFATDYLVSFQFVQFNPMSIQNPRDTSYFWFLSVRIRLGITIKKLFCLYHAHSVSYTSKSVSLFLAQHSAALLKFLQALLPMLFLTWHHLLIALHSPLKWPQIVNEYDIAKWFCLHAQLSSGFLKMLAPQKFHCQTLNNCVSILIGGSRVSG